MSEQKYIEVDDIKYYYNSQLKVSQFQKLSGLIGKLSDKFTNEDVTAGEFAGTLAEEGCLVDLLCILLNTDIATVDNLPLDKVQEVVNDFFFTNGLWLMVSGFIPMPSEVSKLLSTQTNKMSQRAGLGKRDLQNLESKKKKTKTK